MSIANSGYMFVLCAIPVAFALAMAIYFMKFAWKKGVQIGLKKEEMKGIVASSMIFSIVPSIAVLIMLMALMVNLGKFFPWLRLSVIGSGVYETMAANIGLQAFGFEKFAQMTPTAFVGIMFIMTTGYLFAPILNAVLLKSYDKGLKKAFSKQAGFSAVLTGAMFCGINAVWVPQRLLNFKNVPGIMAVIFSALAMALCIFIEKVTKSKKFGLFSMSIAMIIGMIAAIAANVMMK